MAQKLTSSNRMVELPLYAQDGFRPAMTPMIGKRVTLAGRLLVDYQNVRSGWTIIFAAVSKEEYDELRELWNDQHNNDEFLAFSDDELNIHGLPVYMTMPPEHVLKWNKSTVLDLMITLEPRDADSI